MPHNLESTRSITVTISPRTERSTQGARQNKYAEEDRWFARIRSSTSVTCADFPGRDRIPIMATANRKKALAAPTSIKRRSATDTLLDTMRDIIEDGARGMTPKERLESEKKFNAALDRAVASRKRRRETA